MAGNSTQARPRIIHVFDWDNNVFYMPTKVFLKLKKSVAIRNKKDLDEEKELSITDFTRYKTEIGSPGSQYENYHEKLRTRDGTHRNFGDWKEGENRFRDDIGKALADKDWNWKGPLWDVFCRSMNDPEIREDTHIVTSRKHHPDNISEGLKLLVSKKMISTSPPPHQIWTIGHPEFCLRYNARFEEKMDPEQLPSRPDRKAMLLSEILDETARTDPRPDCPPVLSPKGNEHLPMNIVIYSEDDLSMILFTRTLLQNAIEEGKWRNTKIILLYSDPGNPLHKGTSFVLVPGADPRPLEDNEDEWKIS